MSRSLSRPGFILVLLMGCGTLNQCFFGGLVVKGGHSYNPIWLSQVTLLHDSEYQIICPREVGLDLEKESIATDTISEAKKASIADTTATQSSPPLNFTYIPPEQYRGGCELTTQSSVFYLLNMWPITAPLDLDYAMARAIQQREGDSLVGIQIWHEVHYYGIVGRVMVMKLRADVIRYIK